MRFVVDESTGPAVAEWLRDQGHNFRSWEAMKFSNLGPGSGTIDQSHR